MVGNTREEGRGKEGEECRLWILPRGEKGELSEGDVFRDSVELRMTKGQRQNCRRNLFKQEIAEKKNPLWGRERGR